MSVEPSHKRGRDSDDNAPEFPEAKRSRPLRDWLAKLVPESWQEVLAPVTQGEAWENLRVFIDQLPEDEVYPPRDRIFYALDRVPLDEVKVVVLGQDPYHGAGQAMGLAFSVSEGITTPPSLRNIRKHLEGDFDGTVPNDLTYLADQGVLLLNTCLTVSAGQANSHAKKGWEEVTDAIIKAVAERCPAVVFLMWGGKAKAKKCLIGDHPAIYTSHPSPLAAHISFFKKNQFVAANEILVELGCEPIQWVVPIPWEVKLVQLAKAGDPAIAGHIAGFTPNQIRPIQRALRILASKTDDDTLAKVFNDIGPHWSLFGNDTDPLMELLVARQYYYSLVFLCQMDVTDGEALASVAEDMGLLNFASDLFKIK
jgi:uracil-DNA glycosylase